MVVRAYFNNVLLRTPLDCCNDDEMEVSKAIVQGCGLKDSLKMMIKRSLLTEFCVA